MASLAGAAGMLSASESRVRLSTPYARFDSLRRDLTTDSLFGRSGKLRCVLVSESSELAVPLLSQLFGDSVARAPGVYRAASGTASPTVTRRHPKGRR